MPAASAAPGEAGPSPPRAAPGFVGQDAPDPSTFCRTHAPVGFVVVGLGMGHHRAKTLAETPGARLVGVVDTDADRARRTAEELSVEWTETLGPWLARPEVEVVYVMTPTGRHADVALEALEAGRHVLVTKPMEASLAACDAMIRRAEVANRLLAVDFDRRFLPGVLGLRAAVRAGRLGRVLGGEITLKVQRTMDYFRARGGWRGTRRWDGGGVLSNQCVHHVDEAAFVLGIPRRVRADLRTLTHDIEAEDLAAALWEYPEGALVTLAATTSYPQETWYQRFELYGTQGAVVETSGGPAEAAVTRYFVGGAWTDRPPEEVRPEFSSAADNMACAVRSGAPLVADGRDARRTQAILDAMYRSAYTGGGWVEVEAELV